jgi:hypothetical protein
MPLSALLTKFKAIKTVNPTRLLAVEINPETVKTAVWQVDAGQTHVITTGEMKEWDGQEASLLAAVDESLSVALEGIDPEPNQAVLGLPDSWVSGTTINDEAKKLLKVVAEKLELKFVGFVVTAEAIAVEIKRQEGTPLTAILLTMTETEVNVQVVHLGKVLGMELVGRSQDIGADVEEGLARMKISEPLPARMILNDGHLDLEAIRQNLLSYDWQGRLNFLHVPKVDILEREFSIKAVAQAGGSEAAKSLGLETEPAPVAVVLPKAPGFSTDTDVAEETPVVQVKKPIEAVITESTEVTESTEISVPSVNSVSSVIKKLFGRLRWPKWGLWPWMGAGVVLATIAAAVIGYWTQVKAQVTIYVKPQTLEQEVELVADPQAEAPDPDQGIIPARSLETEVEGGLEQNTSGETVVGDRAKGAITIYNKTSQAKTFARGTVLVGPKELKFSLDEEVTIASSSSTTEGITFGKADAPVTAGQIGTESNLDANSEFTLGSLAASSYSAKNATAFSGGTSKTARVVSKDDQQNLTGEVKAKLVAEAKDKLKANLASDELLLDAVVAETVVKQQFSKAVNEEADKVSLVMQLRLTLLAVKQADLQTVLVARMRATMPENFRVEASQTSLEIKAVTVTDGVTNLAAAAKLALVPQFNLEEIKDRIKGRYPELVREYLAGLPNYETADITITPRLPKRLFRLPNQASNITIEVRVAE